MHNNPDIPHLSLTPLIHRWIAELIAQQHLLFSAIEQYESPINIHCIKPFEENIAAYQAVFDAYALRHKIFFARKANKCMAFPLAAARLREGADTASYRELKQCLDAGIASKDLILTAAVKNRKLLELAVDHQVTVVLDNLDEWHLLKEIVEKKQRKININIRLGGFTFEGKTLATRFGFSLQEAFACINHIHKEESWVTYSGLHFHLNGYAVAQRTAAIEQALQLIDSLAAQGIPTDSLDIGGGILMNYLASEQEWADFNRELKLAVLEKREPITYQNDPLGIVKVNDTLYGEPTVYPYFSPLSKDAILKAILTTTSSAYNTTIFKLLADRKLELRMEPGRSLLDQCGITVARVAFRKKDAEGNWLFGLEMNRTQLRSSSADFLLDPIHIPQIKESAGLASFEGYLVGAYCLEQELILKRKLLFSQFPQVGDLVIFPNTAGYMMHFFESEAHLFELAKNLMYENNLLHLNAD
ncbi:alanine racemase [Sphingobacterium sp. Mn56C]|uniref:alanine racemase n=1 Tax=Sphingobacterium sp. Mn56C TaxID=3395261 RepID=UPI003BE67EDA